MIHTDFDDRKSATWWQVLIMVLLALLGVYVLYCITD
jgi:hypothetical protein